MRKFLAAFCLFFALMLPTTAHASEPEPVRAGELVHCGPQGKYIVCTLLGEGIILRIPIPTISVPGQPGPTVTLPAEPRPTKTVTVTPNPVTVTETPDAITETVTVPGGTETVTVKPNTTILNSTATATVTEQPVGSGVVDNDDDSTVLFDLPPLSTTETVGYGALTILGLLGLVLFGMWLFYVLGYKKSEREEMKFLDTLRDQFYTGKHR